LSGSGLGFGVLGFFSFGCLVAVVATTGVVFGLACFGASVFFFGASCVFLGASCFGAVVVVVVLALTVGLG